MSAAKAAVLETTEPVDEPAAPRVFTEVEQHRHDYIVQLGQRLAHAGIRVVLPPITGRHR